MLKVQKLGHLELEVTDLSRMVDHYREVVGLTLTDRDAKTAYMSTVVDHHNLILRQGTSGTRLTKLAFQIAQIDSVDVVRQLRDKGLDADRLLASQPSIDDVVRTYNPDGVAIELYSSFKPASHGYSFTGVSPVKLSHVAALSADLMKSVSFYKDILGFKVSDTVQDFFYFLRCGCDHHSVNILAGQYSGLQHFAFELLDANHMNTALDTLRRLNVEVLWGPVRHGAGHNLATYYLDPEGSIVEFCAELDRMSDEALGYFDPRPYHEDFPQRPKRWDDPRAAGSQWGQFPPPREFGRGVSPIALGIAPT